MTLVPPFHDPVVVSKRPATATESAISEQLLQPFLACWNARDWEGAAAYLEDIENGAGSGTPLLPILTQLRGIALNFHGRHRDAVLLFETPLRTWDGRAQTLGIEGRAAASWLGNTFLLWRKWDEAALAYAVACSNVTLCGAERDASSNQALRFLAQYDDAAYTGKREHLLKWSTFFATATDEENAKFLPQLRLTAKSKAEFFTAALAKCDTKATREELTPSYDAVAPLITLSATNILGSNPWSTVPLLTYDPFIILEQHPYNYIFPMGNPVHDDSLSYRFGNKNHFPMMNITALFTTSRPLSWLVDSLCYGLSDLGFVTHQYWDRIKVVRVREFGSHMHYVASFNIVVHKWMFVNKHGVQIPAHLIQDEFRVVRTPAAWVFPKLCADVKEILQKADARANEMDEAGDDVGSLRSRPVGNGAQGGYGNVGAGDPSVATSRRSSFMGGLLRSSRAMSRTSVASTNFEGEMPPAVQVAERV